MKWLKPSFQTTNDAITKLTLGHIQVFEPSFISLRRYNKTLLSRIKSSCGLSYKGFVSQDWALWFLTQMRDTSLVHLIVNDGKFSNGHTVNQGNFGPSCKDFSTHPNYSTRSIRTYLDNEDNFFFA